MKSIKQVSALFLMLLFVFSACSKKNEEEKEKPFVLTDHFIAGTLTPQSGSYTSVFFINFLENNKAVFISTSATNLTGDYTLTDEELIFEVADPNNYRLVKFGLDADKKIVSAYYKALAMEYGATGELLPIETTNMLAGKSFKGEEFKMGPASNRTGLIYSFHSSGNTYGSDTDAAAIDNTTNQYTLINGYAFKHTDGGVTELGYMSGNKLTTFRVSGLYYYGQYDQQ